MSFMMRSKQVVVALQDLLQWDLAGNRTGVGNK
jgi:hypothetical protein